MKHSLVCLLFGLSLAACERHPQAPAPTEVAQTASTPANTSTLKVRIDGMVCGGCAEAAQQALERVDGVRSADVSFEEGMATVVCDPGVNPDKLVAVLQNVEMNGEKMPFEASISE